MEINAEEAEEALGARAAALEFGAQQPEAEPVLETEPGVRQGTEQGADPPTGAAPAARCGPAAHLKHIFE